MDRVRLRRWGMGSVCCSAFGYGVFACSSDDTTSGGTPDGGGSDATPSDGAPTDAGSDQSAPAIDCDVAIVGGGPGGVHTAYKLTNPDGGVTGVSAGSGVCLFEKNDRLGGRIRDIAWGPNPDDVGDTGARRMYDNQYTHDLAVELGVQTVAPYDFSNLRGLQDPNGDAGQFFGYSGSAFEPLYGVNKSDDEMWVELICGAQVPKDGTNHPNYAGITGGIATKSTADYVKDVFGANGQRYFLDQNRFRADFEDTVDAVGYMEYAAIDWYGSGATVYPIPGHSAIIGKMQAAITAKGGRIFLSEAVTSVASTPDGAFRLTTGNRTVNAKQVVLAVPPGAMGKITGDVVTSIAAAKEFTSVTSAKSMQVTHQWDKKWWKGNLRYPNAAKVVGGDLPDGSAPILRADTTIMPDGYCINSIEMPYTDHHDGLMVTRSVYSDNRACVEKNQQLYGAGGATGEAALNAEILKSLRVLFPAVFDGSANEPKITKTDVNVHDEAWFYLKKGATANGVTNKSVFDWSSNPLPGKKVYLVGDPWYPLGSGWSNAAYITSIRVLNDHFGGTMPSHELQPIACP